MDLSRPILARKMNSGLTYRQLATVSGVCDGTLRNIVNNRHSPNLSALEAIAGVFNIPCHELIREAEIGGKSI